MVSSNTLASNCSIDNINKKLARNNLYADFVQTKTIKVLTRPLISKGQLWMSEQQALVWQVLFPIKSTMVLHSSGVTQFAKDDSFLGKKEHAMVTDLSNVFLLLLSGNMEKLNRSFSTSLTCDNNSDQWQLALKPKAEKIKNFISYINISGGKELENILFAEKRGDKTELNLSHKDSNDFSQLEKYLRVE